MIIQPPVIALDYGTQFIGLAIARTDLFLIQPLKAFKVGEGLMLGAWKRLLEEHQCQTLIVGIPYYSDGKASEMTKTVKAYVNKLKKHLKEIDIYFEDERFSTEEAKKRFPRQAQNKAENEHSIDSLSACVILESFLQARGLLE